MLIVACNGVFSTSSSYAVERERKHGEALSCDASRHSIRKSDSWHQFNIKLISHKALRAVRFVFAFVVAAVFVLPIANCACSRHHVASACRCRPIWACRRCCLVVCMHFHCYLHQFISPLFGLECALFCTSVRLLGWVNFFFGYLDDFFLRLPDNFIMAEIVGN